MPKLIHYRIKCIGCGVCHELQPNCWRMSKKDGKATLLRSVAKKDIYILTIDDATATKEAVVGCPVRIIKVV